MERVHSIKSKKRKKRFRIRYFFVILLVVYIIYILIAQQVAINQARNKEIYIKEQIEKLNTENDQIKIELEKTQDEKYIEKLARARLGLIKPGEIMFIDVNYKEQNAGN